MSTLLLSRSDVEQLLDLNDLLLLLKKAFIDYSLRLTIPAQRHRSSLPNHLNSAAVLFPGLSRDFPVYSVKVHAKHPDYHPSIKGVLHLHDLEHEELLEIMDSTFLIAVHTGLTAALATDLLAHSSADTVAIIGAGA